MFPQWLNRYLPAGPQSLEQARYGLEGYDITRPSIGLDFCVRKVCAPCNNGWLSNLEASSISTLDPLITTLRLQMLPLTAQRLISLWAAKTAIMLDNTQTDPILPPAKLSRMRNHRAIPGGTRVWLGACAELHPLVMSHTVRIATVNIDGPDKQLPTGFYAPMKIGHLCLYVYFPMMDFVIQHPPEYHIALARIWPRRASDLPWPPPGQPRDSAEFELFANSLRQSWRVFSVDHALRHGVKES